MKKTIITHFYNEEYLLPWWLNHHKKLFDHGILINYDSTDRSVEIIKEICPTWEIVKSKNKDFDHFSCDREVEEIEKTVQGWKITLTLAEFFIGDIDEITNVPEQTQLIIPTILFFEYDPYGKLDTSKPLWEQIKMGFNHLSRSLHNFNLVYPNGRHYPIYTLEDAQKQKAIIFKYTHCIVGEQLVKRKQELFSRISERDKRQGLGTAHHYVPEDQLKDWYQNVKNGNARDLDEEIIKPFTKFLPWNKPSFKSKLSAGYSGFTKV